MLFFFSIVIGMINSCRTQSNTGTTLFYNKEFKTDCWSEDDLAKLRARMIFNQIIPQQTTPNQINKVFVNDAIRYYRKALHTVDKQEHTSTKKILRETLVDTVGGHLRSELLPSARLAYYAGYVPYKNVRELHEFYDELKLILNTQGQGWKKPVKVRQLANLTVVKIMIGPGKLFDPCDCLVIQRDSNSCIHLPIPRVDDDFKPSAIALPFKHGGLVNLQSPKAENILLKYYTTAARCILRSSPEDCRHSDFVNFNNDLWHWMKRDVAPHLLDEKLYAAYGGVLRIAAAVQNYGKGLARRNLFEFYPSPTVTKWQPWKALTDSYLYVNTDWSPGVCVTLVLLAALLICCLQVLFNYFIGNSNGCHCTDTRRTVSKDVEYANIDLNFPAMLPGNDVYYNKTRQSPTVIRSKCTSVGTVKTQKVYDLNENTEKFMDVVMSDAEGENYSSSESNDEESIEKDPNYVNKVKRSASPPKIESSIAQLKIKTRREQVGYAVDTVATAGRRRQRGQGWAWSRSGSSGGESASSGSASASGTGSGTSRSNTRDLAWARRVVSSHSLRAHAKTVSGTEQDPNSYTTPTSHR